ncbi:exodeoxyribonuclease VII large subunit [Salinisphaera sp. LB1]|uniref:exodeoxyribonuclease VII large subunit n=1 Tax=Salinisphaera sp. LB1 TaxID=2183911 RepID=UPI000D705FE9|nr:exodeoxyribonuclease VII large subunit [Salinisphaera sp. LB1]AWN17724.1 Exodeoxyribonuclease VII large subunit [Salinisphaera sp. LB1]
MTAADSGPIVFTVSELNRAARDLLEQSFGLLWVEGEISNLARPRSGHVYFSLKDGEAQVRCALFRNKARLLRVALDNGVQIRVRARVSLYAARGDYQLIVEHAEGAGAGALQRAFEALRARLDAEGLFAVERKRALPGAPARIGVITSATGAAIRDVLSVVSRRYPLGALRIYPVPVQGEAAPPAIVTALTRAGQRADCDVILLVRGGGSLEDLWAFNDETVARAIVACPIPVVSGVGHEVDVTIADLAADVRAATPSAAAELVCPDMAARAAQLPQVSARLKHRIDARLTEARQRLAGLEQRLARQRPRRRLETAAQRLDEAELRLVRIAQTHMSAHRRHLQLVIDRLHRATPARRLAQAEDALAALSQRLDRAGIRRIETAQRRLGSAVRALHSVSPLQTLERGYAIARDAQGHVLRDASTVAVGETVAIDLARGQLDCEVRARHERAGLKEYNNRD